MQSPRTEALMAPPVSDTPKSTDEFFAQSFQDLAMQRFSNEHPEVAALLVAFKVLDADSATGMARGTFILDHSGKELHVPIVLQDNNVQPIDMMYDKDQDKFLPLSAEFFDSVGAQEVDYLGNPENPSSLASSNLDTRNLVIPPATGRMVYAADASLPSSIVALAMARPGVKEAFFNVLKSNSVVATYALNTYGADLYKTAAQMPSVKESSYRQRTKHAAYDPELTSVVTYDTPSSVTRAIFGVEGAPVQELNEYGYAVHDRRPASQVNRAIRMEGRLQLETPTSSGYYRLFLSDGSVKTAWLVVGVNTLCTPYASTTLASSGPLLAGDPRWTNQGGDTSIVGITTDGYLLSVDTPFVAEKIYDNEGASKIDAFIRDQIVTLPRNGQYGFFMGISGAGTHATPVVRVRNVTINGFIRNMVVTPAMAKSSSDLEPMHFVQNEKSPAGSIQVLQDVQHGSALRTPHYRSEEEGHTHTSSGGRAIILIPGSYTFVAGTSLLNSDLLIRSPRAVFALFEQEIALSGGRELSVASSGGNEISINGRTMSKMSAVNVLLRGYGLASVDTQAVIKTAEDQGRCDCSVLSPIGLRRYAIRVKVANSPGAAQSGMPGLPAQAPPPMGEMPIDPNTGAPMDPAMMGMDPAMMGMDPSMMGMVPAAPNPTEIAANEVSQQLMSEYEQIMAELEKRREISEAQITAIQMVVDRANQVAQEMGGAPPDLLPPADVLGMGVPVEEPAPEMVPMQEAPPAPDPTAALPPDAQGPDAMAAAAGTLQDPALFDAASLSTLTELDSFDSSVDQFAPQLEQSLDSVGRMLLNVRSSASDLQERMGYAGYKELEQALKTIFDSTGKAVGRLRRVPPAAESSLSMI